jgi:hypothetical protein
MDGACSKYGGEESRIQGFCWGNLREREHLEDPGVDGRIILRWIELAYDRDRWRALVECGNEPSGSIKCGEFLD